MPVSREALEELIASWLANVNPGCHYCAKQLKEFLEETNDGEDHG